MTKENDLIRIFTGTEIAVILLKGELEENGIAALVKNEYQSGAAAGFYGGTSVWIDLYVQESDVAKAEPIVNEFNQNNNTADLSS